MLCYCVIVNCCRKYAIIKHICVTVSTVLVCSKSFASNMNNSWSTQRPVWTSEKYNLLTENKTQCVPNVTLEELEEKSNKFPIKFPIDSVRCKKLKTKVPKEALKRNINSVYPVLHEKSLDLFVRFLLYKRNSGSEIEKKFYANMTLVQFIDRLLNKRAVVFVGSCDSYVIMDEGRKRKSAGWHFPPLTLEKCLSYDEMKLSALLSVSSYTHYINKGDRYNVGEPNQSDVQDVGIIIGLIGTRFEKPFVMEHRDIVITKEQNVESYGYGSSTSLQNLFMNFYEEPNLIYDSIKNEKDPAIMKLQYGDAYFNNNAYEKRLSLSIDTLLIEANNRAMLSNTAAYVYVVGIGLGVWKISEHQKGLFMDVFTRRIRCLSKSLDNISDVCFAYIQNSSIENPKESDKIPIDGHPLGGIKIHIYNREPHEKLKGPDKDKLLVVSYPWDGNALPGNEFWEGQLAASGDPAAASSTQISELHNPHINPKVCADNLRIATPDGLVTLGEYQSLVTVDTSSNL